MTMQYILLQNISDRLRHLRTALNLSQSDMAVKMGVTARVYRRYENGEHVPGSDKLVNLLKDVKDISPAWLISGEGGMFRTCEEGAVMPPWMQEIAGHPKIEKIVLMLTEMEDEDIQTITSYIEEKKRFRDLESDMREFRARYNQDRGD